MSEELEKLRHKQCIAERKLTPPDVKIGTTIFSKKAKK